MKKLLIIYLTLIFLFSSYSDEKSIKLEKKIKKYESKIIHLIKTKKITGLSIALFKKDKILWSKGYGFSNIEKQIKADKETLFRVASITKPFTALAVLQLNDKGLIDIDKEVYHYIGDFKIGKNDDYKKIKIKHLLTHSSGIVRGLNSKNFNDLIKKLSNTELLFIPGSKYSYSNAGYNVLGKIIEEITKMSFENYMDEFIFKELNMKKSKLWIHQKSLPIAQGYIIKDNSFKEINQGGYNSSKASGSMCSTVIDLCQLLQLLSNEGEFNHKIILSKKNIKKMLNSQFQSRTYGLGIYFEGIVGHGGDTKGFTSVLEYSHSNKTGVVILTNTSNESGFETSKLIKKLCYEMITDYWK